MTTLPLPEIGHQSYYLISSANRVLLGNKITEFVCDRLVELTLLEDNGEELLFRIEHHRHVTKGTALIHYYNDELCDMYSDMRVAVGYDGAVRDITDFDGVRSRWKLKRTEILREYSSDVEPLVEGTSQLLEDKEKFVHSLFGGYGFWRIFFQPWYHREFEEMERSGASTEELDKLGAGKLNLATHKGDVENGSVMIGQISGMLNDILPVADIIHNIVEGLPGAVKSAEAHCK